MKSRPLEKKVNKQTKVDFLSGFVSGVVGSVVFHPWDRALYLSVSRHVPFLSVGNFMHPWQGIMQTVAQRTVSNSSYFFMQGETQHRVYPHLTQLGFSRNTAQFCVGMMSGSMNGLLASSLYAVKFHTWSKPERTFRTSALEMWAAGGHKPFFKTMVVTVQRDIIFGSVYEVLRHNLQTVLVQPLLTDETKKQNPLKCSGLTLFSNSMAGGVATATASPFNYVRNIKYAVPADQVTPKTPAILHQAWVQSKAATVGISSHNLLIKRFKLGWGSARVALGMGFGQFLFDSTKDQLKKRTSSSTELVKDTEYALPLSPLSKKL